MSIKENKNINLVHDSNLEEFLGKLEILDDFNNNKKKCKFCRNIVNSVNLHSLFKESSDVKLVCDSPECIKEAILYFKR